MAKIYIASSWKNQHAVEMMTDLLQERGHEVLCFVRHSAQEQEAYSKPGGFEAWLDTTAAKTCFHYDTDGATQSDCVLYIGPSGTDAWAEVGAAWAKGVPIVGLWAKGEQAGLMRKMMTFWTWNYQSAIHAIRVAIEEKRAATL